MDVSSELHFFCKVYYRPIEAAIRWSGLARHEDEISAAMKGRNVLEPHEFPRWPALRLNSERIYDALVNRELPFGIAGVTVHDESLVHHPDLTIRHVDLKSWMTRYYPEQRPKFLFSRIERSTHPTITFEIANALLFEQELLKSQVERYKRQAQSLCSERLSLLKQIEGFDQSGPPDETLSLRSESTYLNIIGAFLALFLGRSPSGQFYSSFRTQESVISALIAHHGGTMGITERTLETKFAAAKRKLSGE